MDRETVYRMRGFVDELQKEAAIIPWLVNATSKIPYVGPKAVGFATGALKNRFGRQLALGATLGGGTGYLASDEEGGHRLRNTLIGAGAGMGLAGGRILASPAARAELGTQLKRGGKRLKYQLTGGGLEGTPAEREAEAIRLKILHKPPAEQLELGGKSGKAWDAYKREQDAFRRGEYSAPGVFHSLLSKPGTFFKQQWQRNPLLMKAFTGLSAYQAGKGIIEKPEEGGPGRFEKGLGSAGQGVGWLASPHGFFPGLAVAPLLGKAGKMVGHGLDTALGTRAAPRLQPPEQYSPGGGV